MHSFEIITCCLNLHCSRGVAFWLSIFFKYFCGNIYPTTTVTVLSYNILFTRRHTHTDKQIPRSHVSHHQISPFTVTWMHTKTKWKYLYSQYASVCWHNINIDLLNSFACSRKFTQMYSDAFNDGRKLNQHK